MHDSTDLGVIVPSTYHCTPSGAPNVSQPVTPVPLFPTPSYNA
jgi:hypothetical protein